MTPIVLSANVTLAAGATGAPDLQRLVPPLARPMLVSTISFTVQTPSATYFASSAGDYQFASIIGARILAGRHALTDGFVPLTNFAPNYSRTLTRNNPYYNNVLTDALVAAQGEFYEHRRWILPKPLYLSPGEGVNVTFNRSTIFDALLNANIVSGSFRVSVAVHGSLLFKPQTGTRLVPYVAAAVPSSLIAANTYARAPEPALRNTLNKTLMVQRFIGTITVPSAVAGAISPSPGMGALVELADSSGYDITGGMTRSSVQWMSVFPEQRNCYVFTQPLAAGDMYKVAATTVVNNSYPIVSFVGSREEAI